MLRHEIVTRYKLSNQEAFCNGKRKSLLLVVPSLALVSPQGLRHVLGVLTPSKCRARQIPHFEDQSLYPRASRCDPLSQKTATSNASAGTEFHNPIPKDSLFLSLKSLWVVSYLPCFFSPYRLYRCYYCHYKNLVSVYLAGSSAFN